MHFLLKLKVHDKRFSCNVCTIYFTYCFRETPNVYFHSKLIPSTFWTVNTNTEIRHGKANTFQPEIEWKIQDEDLKNTL